MRASVSLPIAFCLFWLAPYPQMAVLEGARRKISLDYPMPKDKDSRNNLMALQKAAGEFKKLPLPLQGERFHDLVAKCLRGEAPSVHNHALHYAAECGCVACHDILVDFVLETDRKYWRVQNGENKETLRKTYYLAKRILFDKDLEGTWEIFKDQKTKSFAFARRRLRDKVRFLLNA